MMAGAFAPASKIAESGEAANLPRKGEISSFGA
jgi:hypothetical protein